VIDVREIQKLPALATTSRATLVLSDDQRFSQRPSEAIAQPG
jgi:hypothetical protein